MDDNHRLAAPDGPLAQQWQGVRRQPRYLVAQPTPVRKRIGDLSVLHQHFGQPENVQDAAWPAAPRRAERDAAQTEHGAVEGPLQAANLWL